MPGASRKFGSTLVNLSKPFGGSPVSLDLGGEVTWERLRAKGLNRWLKENAKTRHFSEAVSNLIANAEGELVKTYPVTWRR